jgi:hypothetical protein
MAPARSVAGAFSPLDEQLALPAGNLSPVLSEWLVRLGSWLPFAPAARLLADFAHVTVSAATARRRTEAAGATLVALQTEQVAIIERDLPDPPAGSARMYFSADGAMVPLRGGEWAEVKTLVLGSVTTQPTPAGPAVRTAELSYFSRLTDAASFERLSLVETQRRGLECAGAVAAVMDGAEWEQGLIDYHCPQAVRILDFPHALEHVAAIGQAVWGAGPTAQTWLTQQAKALKEQGPAVVLAEVAHLQQEHPAVEGIAEHQAYLTKRAGQMQYPAYQAAGWPLGSGATESANKLVVEARLKGAGMHWAREQVNAMLALRNAVCNDRWAESWGLLVQRVREQGQQRRAAQQRQRQAPRPAPQATIPPAPTPAAGTPAAAGPPVNAAVVAEVERLLHDAAVPVAGSGGSGAPAAPRAEKEPWRPAANHPWRRAPIGKAVFLPRRQNAKQ